MTIHYTEVRTLERRGPIDPEPSEPVEGILLVATESVLRYEDHHSQYGYDEVFLFPAVHRGERCWLRREEWYPAPTYSASGTNEQLIPFEEGVSILIEHECYAFPLPGKV